MRTMTALLCAAALFGACDKIMKSANQTPSEKAAAEAKEAREEAENKARYDAELKRRGESCRTHPKCEAGGLCAYGEPDLGVDLVDFSPNDCVVRTTSDCIASRLCTLAGHCTADFGVKRCVIGPEDCARAKVCVEEGYCSRDIGRDEFSDVVGRHCVPATNADCERGSVSKAEGRVCAVDGACVKPKRKGKCPGA